MPNKWEKEHEHIFAKYAKYGYKTIQRKLKEKTNTHFTLGALYHYAEENMIDVGYGKSEVPLVWLGQNEHGHAHRCLLTAALRDGVARKTKSKGNKYVVPAEWADRMAERISKEGFEGIHKDNLKKRASKPKRLNEEIVKAIRANPKNLNNMQLAQKFGVSSTTIWKIRSRRTHKDVK